MLLLKAHRLLIASGIVMSIIFVIRQVVTYTRTRAPTDLLGALVAAGVVVALGFYYRSIRHKTR
jgi:uncharacterized membrane protein (DUF373 family)